MNKTVIPFNAEHIYTMDDETVGRLGRVGTLLKDAESLPQMGPCFSAFVGGKCIACAGVILKWNGAGQAWAFVSRAVFKYPKFFHQSVKQGLESIIKKHNLHRVEANVMVGLPHGKEWIERLGFECEGMMKKFDIDGNDHWLYARVM